MDTPLVATRTWSVTSLGALRLWTIVGLLGSLSMLIDIQVARSLQLQIKSTVLCEQFQHVIEKADAGRDLIGPLAVDGKAAANLRFFRNALD